MNVPAKAMDARPRPKFAPRTGFGRSGILEPRPARYEQPKKLDVCARAFENVAVQPKPLSSPESPSTEAPKPVDWKARYANGDVPWDRHSAAHVLDRVLREWQIRPCRALDMGCGTGTLSVRLAREGFQVSAFDLVPRAIEMAKEKAQRHGVTVDFWVADFRAWSGAVSPFPFVFDSGLYHCVRREWLGDWLTFLGRVTEPGSLYLTIAGNDNETKPAGQGPPRVRASEMCAELEERFALIELRETHFEASDPTDGWHPLAWSALWRRR